MADVGTFQKHILEAGVLDPEGVHHEFVSGMHGRKLDFDTIETGSDLYNEWVGVTAGYISNEFPDLPAVIVGVANGTNRLALDTAEFFSGVRGLVSEKDSLDSKKLYLGEVACELIRELKPKLVVVVEDVGTTGSNSVQVARECLDHGAKEVEVVTTWQRRPQLEKLEASGIPYRAVIKEELDTFTPEDCRAHGYCSQGYEFIPREK
jgi:orotate phosphoribosyltransferase